MGNRGAEYGEGVGGKARGVTWGEMEMGAEPCSVKGSGQQYGGADTDGRGNSLLRVGGADIMYGAGGREDGARRDSQHLFITMG